MSEPFTTEDLKPAEPRPEKLGDTATIVIQMARLRRRFPFLEKLTDDELGDMVRRGAFPHQDA